ncbi:alpha/beta hydrolase [Streptomyces sp. HNM0574]|uniref:alpha/beta hydrolase n=1 Tax=Streptomyces sp. HNM0574 TaxID=2714954 RepID=UPI00146A43FE|nr:alpha/beta hydrolase [Streptomyces sp. HNM0574]NLU66163.1 alpha/beta hydrolase [Streptomyces sp. HNM0574]
MPDSVIRTARGGGAVEVHRPSGGERSGVRPVVLLWHGVSPDDREVMRPLAEELARRGVLVFVPGWRSDAADRGCAGLLESLRFAYGEASAYGGDPERLVVAGWSAGAPAAVGLAYPGEEGLPRPAAVVGVAGRYDIPARTTGVVPLEAVAVPGVPVFLVHGSRDPVVVPAHSRDFAAAVARAGGSVPLEEVDADHAGVVGTEYDPSTDRCRPSADPAVVDQGRRTADVVARAAGLPAVDGRDGGSRSPGPS